MKKYLFALLVGSLLLTVGCSPTVAEIMEMHDRDLVANNFKASMPHMAKLIADDKKNTHEDTPLWRLMVANAQVLTADENAVKSLDTVEDVILNNDKKGENYYSAMLVNDRMLVFKPSFQDRMYLCLDKATVYAGENKNDEARLEFNRMMQYQENWLFERRKEIQASEAAMAKSLEKDEKSDLPPIVAQQVDKLKIEAKKTYENLLNNGSVLGMILKNCNFDLKNSGDINKMKPNDYQNAYTTHLCGVFRWLNGDDGIAYLKDAVKLKPQNAIIVTDFNTADKNEMPKSDVWIYVEDGLCPIRQEVRMDLPIALVPFAGKYVKAIALALPKLVFRKNAAKTYTVAGVPMEELEDIDHLLKAEYDVYMHSAVKREWLRCLLKAVPQVAAGIAADSVSNSYAKMGCQAAQIAAAEYAIRSTLADLRSWNVLPKRILMQRVKRPADGMIKLAADGKTVDIKVAEGSSIVVVRKVAENSPFVVRQINFANAK